jgi:hypothetical protein
MSIEISYSPNKKFLGEPCLFAFFGQPEPGVCGHSDNPLNGQCNGKVNAVCVRILERNKTKALTQKQEVVIFQG